MGKGIILSFMVYQSILRPELLHGKEQIFNVIAIVNTIGRHRGVLRANLYQPAYQVPTCHRDSDVETCGNGSSEIKAFKYIPSFYLSLVSGRSQPEQLRA